MKHKLTIESMLDGLRDRLGEEDFIEPLSILIESANKNNRRKNE